MNYNRFRNSKLNLNSWFQKYRKERIHQEIGKLFLFLLLTSIIFDVTIIIKSNYFPYVVPVK